MKKLAHETILELMKEKITTGIWKPGDRLPTLAQLAEEFGISITAVREGLRILESQRIVSIEHGRGIFVTNDPAMLDDPTARIRRMENSSLLHLLEARMVLEPELSGLCAVRATMSQRRQLRQLAAMMAEQMEHGGDFFATDLQFHHTIADGADNPVLAQMLAAISDLSAVGRQETNRLPDMRVKASNFHNLIAIAIDSRNAEQARELMRMHIHDMIESVNQQATASAKPSDL